MHCLNLKLTYDCTNNCSFCFSSYLKDNIITYEGLADAVIKGFNNGCRELVLSGGEPTLLAGTIEDILILAEQLGYEKYIIQTNGSGLSSNDHLVDFLDELAKKNELCISFSIHGSCAEIHDRMSSTNGAFELLIKAMDKIKDTSCLIYTNTVISKLNIGHLEEIGNLCQSYNAEIIQFSMMHLETPSELSTGLVEAAQAVKKLSNKIDADILKTEGIPYCLMHGIEQCVGESFWPSELDLYNKENDYMPDFSQLQNGMRWKKNSCIKCIMNEICMGIWKEHSNEYIEAGVRPIC